MDDKAGAVMEIMQVLEKHNATVDNAKWLFREIQLRILSSTTIAAKDYTEAINLYFGEPDQ